MIKNYCSENLKDSINSEKLPLGKKSRYISKYMPSLLVPIPRKIKRQEIGVLHELPFTGFDIWNAFELSWLNNSGKPIVAIGQFIFPCESPNIIESKSFKLYLNSFNNTKFDSVEAVKKTLEDDLSKASGLKVEVIVKKLNEFNNFKITCFDGECIDDLDVEFNVYQVNPKYLIVESDELVEEVLYSDLLKSNCLVTGQPDWGSVQINYKGKKINRAGLLKYIVSLRNHNEFHEQCVERIFFDIMNKCDPEKLTVYARYTRRGGIDINPFRSSEKNCVIKNIRLARQ